MDRFRGRHAFMAGGIGCGVENSKGAIDLDRVEFLRRRSRDELRYLAGDYPESTYGSR